MEKLKELWEKLNLKVALVGGVVVVSTSLGTCHLVKNDAPEESPIEETTTTEEVAPAEVPEEVPATPETPEEE